MNESGFILLLIGAIAILIAITAHGYTMALVSTLLGDPLPKQNKRLSLNPIVHFEPIGFILMMYTNGFGWGKPLETNGLYYENRKKGVLLTAILPSVVNLILGLLFYILIQIFSNGSSLLGLFFAAGMRFNIMLAIYNLVPIPPMDCVKVLSVLLPANQYYKYMQYEKIIQLIFVVLLIMGFFGQIFNGLYGLIVDFFGILLFFL